MSGLEAIIFDVDGTMADTEEVHRRAFNETFAENGLDWSWDRALYAELLQVTGGKERMRHYVSDHLGQDPARFDIVDMHARKTARYVALIASGDIPLRPGVARLIAEARGRGVKLAIATTTSPANVEALVTATLGPDAMEAFAAVGAGDAVKRKKPAPDVYDIVIEALALNPSACIALEDSENGVRSARAAGVPTLVTINDYTEGQDFSGAVAVVSDLGEPGAPTRTLAGVDIGAELVDVDALAALVAAAA